MQVWSKSIHCFQRKCSETKLRGRLPQQDPHQNQYAPLPPHRLGGGGHYYQFNIGHWTLNEKLSVKIVSELSSNLSVSVRCLVGNRRVVSKSRPGPLSPGSPYDHMHLIAKMSARAYVIMSKEKIPMPTKSSTL